MNSADFARYIHMEIIGEIFISDKTLNDQGFEIYVRGTTPANDKYIELHGRAVETTRGSRRHWSDIGRAYDFIKECGWTEKVLVELFLE